MPRISSVSSNSQITRVNSDNYSYTSRYSLIRSRPRVAEGSDFTITLVTANVADTTTVPYTITGVDSSDIGSVSLTGNFTVSNSRSSQTFSASEDATVETPENFVLTLDTPGDSILVQIVDVGFGLSTDKAVVPEGDTFTITLSAVGASDGASIPYTITGVSSADINDESLTGNFIVENEQATKTFTVNEDLIVDPDETFTITLDNFPSATVSVTIKEPSYTLSRSVSAVNEGGGFSITLTTTFLDDNTLIPYTITGIGITDITSGELTGNFTVIENTAVQNFTVSNDLTTEGPETFTLSLDNGKDSISVSINDTSLTPTYALSSSANSVNEGDSFTITLTTTNLPNGSSVPYSISGVNSSDINGASTTGNFSINSNSAELVITVTADQSTEGTETFIIALDNGSDSLGVTINDTSRTPALQLQRGVAQINEGGTFVIYLYTQNIAPGTLIPYTITGVSSADINGASLTGNFTISSDQAQLIVVTTADATTEGDETFTITLNDYPSVSTSLTIIDSSRTPTYTLSRSASSVSEGDSFTITLTTTDVEDDTTIPYTITGVSSADINNASLTGNFTISSNSATLGVNVTADYATDGTETFSLQITAGTNPSISVTINDTTVFGTLAYSISSVPFVEHMTIGGNYLVTGHPGVTLGPTTYGYARLYRLSNGTALTTMQNRLNGTSTFYGGQVWTNGFNVAVAAPFDRQFGAGASQGVVFFYQIINNGASVNLGSTATPNYAQTAGGESTGRSMMGNNNVLIIGSHLEQVFYAGSWVAEGGWAGLYNSSGQALASFPNPNSETSGGANDQFGAGVAINSDSSKIAVGAPLSDHTYTFSGSVYVYNSSGTQLTRIDGSAANMGIGYWNSMDMNDNYLCIKARYENSNYGSMLVVSLSDYTVRRINNPLTTSGFNWGNYVKCNSTHVAIPDPTATGPDSGFANEGVVYYYRLSDLTLERTFTIPVADRGNSFTARAFGSKIALTDNRLAAYATNGKIYVYGLAT